ncbi:MAG: alpha/beta fold hydrolase [Pseudomonadota bacterium]|nr:alpha/beta fold hydrolase [Pseudomonadota bacterium]
MLRSGQFQTTLGNLPPIQWLARRRGARLLANAEEWVLDCGAGVRLHGLLSAADPLDAAGRQGGSDETVRRRIAVVLHGWEGSADSSYVISLGAELLASGFDVLRLNLRDHGESHHLNREIFHSCRLEEVVGATRAVAHRYPDARIFLGGFSLGGNFMLRVAANAGAPKAIAGVVAVSPVLDPTVTLEALERGSFIYRRYFVRKWSRSLRHKRRAWPDLPDFEPILRTRNLRAMTAGLVREFTDFGSLEAYLDGYAIIGTRLASLGVPATVLLADDDPMIPAADLARLAPSPGLTIVRTRHGGHCGFAESLKGPSFADRLVVENFQRFDEAQ